MDNSGYSREHAELLRRLSVVKRLQEKANGEETLQEDERDLLFESMFMSAFRSFENFVENCFIYSMQGLADMSGNVVPRFAQPISRSHARDMLLGAQTVLDWTSSTTILRRHETFLNDTSSGLYLGLTGIASTLQTAKDLRNHIAHNSDESGLKFAKVVAAFFPTPPLETLTPGALLSTTPRIGPARNFQVLTYFREKFTQAGRAVSRAP